MNIWFMVFDKPPYNNKEAQLHFLHKLLVNFIMGFHVNYFDISEFKGVCLRCDQDQERFSINPLRGVDFLGVFLTHP